MITPSSRAFTGATSGDGKTAEGVAEVWYTGTMPRKKPLPKSQLPAASAAPEAVEGARKRLPEPPRSALAQMRRHLVDEHGEADFRPERDLYLGGEARRHSHVLTWNPGNATFHCDRCPGSVFWTGEITESMVERAQLFNDDLRPHLAGLDRRERDAMTRHYLRGDLNRERLRQLQGAGARRRAGSSSRPTVAERRSNVQAWMLDRYVELGTVERVLVAAEELQREDPDAWLAFAFRRLAGDTLRKYWQDVDPDAKEDARRRFERKRPKKLTRPNT